MLVIAASMDFPSTWQAGYSSFYLENFRIYVYSGVMLFLGFLKRIKIDYSNLDPLGMTQWAWVLHLIDITFQINAFYLLIRLVTDISLIHSSIVIIQYCFTYTAVHILLILILIIGKRFLNSEDDL